MMLLIFATLGVGSFWAWNTFPQAKGLVNEALNIGKFQTLEVRHSAESIMETHKRQLLLDSEHSFLAPRLKFHPYLLMEIKYTKPSERTGEGIILWSLVDGEMVINTSNWEKTHGFSDCIHSSAGRSEFQIINALAASGGSLDHEGLSKALNLEEEKLNQLLALCRKKSLIVQNGNYFRLHLENPKLHVIPETKLDQWLVTKPSKNAKRIGKRFRAFQIESMAKAAFGNNFAIRKKTEIFLPVYSIVVQNPDGSQKVTHWNALNGKQIQKAYYFE